MKIATNFDYTWDPAVALHLQRNPGSQAEYPAWNFYAVIAWDEDLLRWDCDVWHYNQVTHHLHDQTIPGIMRQASDIYGYD